MDKIRRVDFSPDEFIVGVAGLSPELIGAYWMACSLMYSKGGPIDDDEVWIAHACGWHVRTWRALRLQLIAAGKLQIVDGMLTNGRVSRELLKAESRVSGARLAAEASVRERRRRRENKQESFVYRDIPETTASEHSQANHQPSTINSYESKIVGESHTVERGTAAEKSVDASSIPKTPAPTPAASPTQLPKKWEPDGKLEEWATTMLEEQAPQLKYRDEVDQFRDHYRGKGESRSNWPAVFRFWIRESIKRSKRNGKADYQGGKLGGAARAHLMADIVRSGKSTNADGRRRQAEPVTVGSASLADEKKRSR